MAPTGERLGILPGTIARVMLQHATIIQVITITQDIVIRDILILDIAIIQGILIQQGHITTERTLTTKTTPINTIEVGRCITTDVPIEDLQ